MLRELPAKQFLWWRAYDLIEPIGDRRGDWQAASICATIVNAMLVAVRSKKRMRIEDFLLTFTDKKTPTDEGGSEGQPWQRMKFIARMLAAAANAPQRGPKRR